jgi:two-component system sensor histidine kinase RpfC
MRVLSTDKGFSEGAALHRRFEQLLRESAEFQSSLVRLAVWLFAVTYVGVSSLSEHHQVDTDYYVVLFSAYLIVFIAIFLSVLRRSEWPARQYLSLVIDITATSFAIFLTGDVTSPFFILYFWIFLSYGTRYGKRHLMVASLVSAVAYLLAVIAIPGWRQYGFEISFVLLSLILLPFYQFALLRKLHEAKQQAERAHREAEASSQAKSAFLANMSHEIRTPLNGLMSMGQLLLGTRLNHEQREYAENLVNSGRALNTVLNEVLDFSKIEAGVLEIKPVDFQLRPLLAEIMQLMRFSAESKLLKLDYHCDPSIDDHWHGDASRLRQILINLIGNAIRFTQQGEVLLCVDRISRQGLHERLRFSVIDTGIGIPGEKLGKLFQRFSQLDETPSRGYGGTGLGLAISKHLTEAMGGSIGVRSELGKGSTFWIELPLRPAIGGGGEEAWTEAGGVNLQGLRVLLVDDDAINRLAGQRMLEQHQAEVLLANDGREALQQLKAHEVDLVLMDVHMPNLDGIEATRRIRADGDNRLPIIGLTASVMKEEQQRYLDAGMDDVVAKPVEAAQLLRTINIAITARQPA